MKIAYKNLKGTSIEKRPKEVNKRTEYGHWEMDCVVGKKDENILDKLDKKLGKSFKQKFETITVDNRSEFLDYKGLKKSCIDEGQIVKIYYAHTYSLWERGTNENSNKLIRRFIPKGADISKYTDADIKRIEHWMNLDIKQQVRW